MVSRTVSNAARLGELLSKDEVDMVITLVDRHVTVVLNGKQIIDNQPLLGCTGGAMTSDEFKPGPIYLQGDHGPVKFRNITISVPRK